MNVAKYLVLYLFMEKVPIFQLHSLNFANLGEMMKAQANILIVLIFVHFFREISRFSHGTDDVSFCQIRLPYTRDIFS